MLSGQRGTDDLGGPLRIAQLSVRSPTGLASLIGFIAVLSINLGLINLFPVPILDGGHLLFYAIEAMRGRPLPPGRWNTVSAPASPCSRHCSSSPLGMTCPTWRSVRWIAALIGPT